LKVLNLTQNSKIYTSNVFLGTGNWNTINDVNTLIDVGRDIAIIGKIYNSSTGVGKHKVEQIILTHSHYDHIGILALVKKEFNCKVFAFSKSVDGVDQILVGGELLKIGDLFFQVIHAPGHSSDSICLYNRDEKLLFAGDNPIVINTDEGKYDDTYVSVLEALTELPIDKIYVGHGNPICGNCKSILENTLRHIKAN
jgi:glyoxylase-like metal-dependent hydrolase (beta-lactamase superfamily II)